MNDNLHNRIASKLTDASDAFISWIDNTLEIERTAHPIWDQRQENFDFRIFSSPEQLEAAIRIRAKEGGSARLTAGFCWPWSKELKPDGTLVEDVVIGSYRKPWNARSEVSGLAPGIPREVLWAWKHTRISLNPDTTASGYEPIVLEEREAEDLRIIAELVAVLG